ncbi:hypothetical protein [Cognatilysobacter lacus]|uniref:Uncharacterized protein n=1 Tax=Cognatilysobacter lacus TaxID=1643323 RepID=A0A5D8Z8T1_9GAMM|nr:hypothetical protein [Lysobacter lacus]TZF90483.1 hypothetical protein FW784_05065 [Lysobacter lacus]
MQYEIAGVPTTLDLPLLTRLITEADPAALVDVAPDTQKLRASTMLDAPELLDVLVRAGAAVEGVVVDRLPSQCCGGCGG